MYDFSFIKKLVPQHYIATPLFPIHLGRSDDVFRSDLYHVTESGM